MKKKIHPVYHKTVKAACACGHNFETGSTEPELKTDICANCHPFYTGKQKLLDTARRAEKFNSKVEKQKELSQVRKTKKVKRAAKAVKKAAK